MNTMTRIASILILAAFAASPALADDRDLLRSRMKSALNETVQDVKAAETPAEKRLLLDRFLGKIERRAAWAQGLPGVGEGNRTLLAALHERFSAHRVELNGANGSPVADADLDAFASFVQNDLEQAEVEWGSGGVYLSAGAIIIILLILILIT